MEEDRLKHNGSLSMKDLPYYSKEIGLCPVGSEEPLLEFQ